MEINTKKIKEGDFPRVLVFNGEPFNIKSATGITISNIFRAWPKNKLALVYTAGMDVNEAMCANNWRLSNMDLLFVNLLKNIKKEKKITEKIHLENKYNSSKSSNFIRKLLIPLVDFLPYHFSQNFLNWIFAFNPDLIYTNLGNIRLVTAVSELSGRLGVPVVAHFMDDWISTYSVPGKSFSTKFHRRVIERKTRNLLCQMPIGLGIGEMMAKEYHLRFGCPFDAFMNPVHVPTATFKRPIKSESKISLKLVYVGGLHLSRFNVLEDIADALLQLNQEGFDLVLLIYTSGINAAEHEVLLRKSTVRFCGSVAPEKVHEVLLDCDIAVHVESFSEREVKYTRLSVSTKIPQYLAAALPVLAYGPKEVASCQYIQNAVCGEVVGERNINYLKDGIRKLAVDGKLRELLGRQAWKVAKERHDIEIECARFRSVLAKVALSKSAISLKNID